MTLPLTREEIQKLRKSARVLRVLYVSPPDFSLLRLLDQAELAIQYREALTRISGSSCDCPDQRCCNWEQELANEALAERSGP